MPLIGLGTWKSKKGEIKEAVISALRSGYRHIDCAEYYANEDEVGEGLQKVFAEGFVKREEVFLTSKLWNNHHSEDSVKPALQSILKNLRVDYLDLLLIHWPVTGNVGPTVQPPIMETWQAMEKLVSEGLVRSIGISNFSVKKIDQILTYAKIPPAVSQVEVHPYWRQDNMIQYCKGKGIHVTAYSPLGSPDSSAMFRRSGPKLMDDPKLNAIAKKLGKSPAQCLIRWGIQHGTSILPKSVNSGRIKANIDVLSWELPRGDFDALCSLQTQMRMVDGQYFLNPKGPYRTEEELWDSETAESTVAPLESLKQKYTFIDNLPKTKLNSGREMPLIGLGTWKSKKGEIKEAVISALRSGYRHIDCAEYYANEDEVGEGLQKVFAEGFVKREEVFLTSKLWNNHHSEDSVKPALQSILKNLRVDYLDLLLIHWPVTGNVGPTVQPPIMETWQAMEKLVSEGLVRSIGISNFSVKKIDQILTYAKIPPAVSQVEVHPYWRQDNMIQYCKGKGIHVTAYSPLGSPDSSAMFRRSGPKLMDDPKLNAIAKKLGKSPAQCLIRWGIQHGTSILPKSVNSGRIKANIDVLSWELPRGDFDALCSLQTQMRMVDGQYFLNPKGPYRTEEEFWDS